MFVMALGLTKAIKKKINYYYMFWTIIRILFYIGLIIFGFFWLWPEINKYIDIGAILGSGWDGLKGGIRGL